MEDDAPEQDMPPVEDDAAPLLGAPTPMWSLDFETTAEPPVLRSLNTQLGDGAFGAVGRYEWHHSHIGQPLAPAFCLLPVCDSRSRVFRCICRAARLSPLHSPPAEPPLAPLPTAAVKRAILPSGTSAHELENVAARSRESLLNELDILSRVRSTNIIACLGAVRAPDLQQVRTGRGRSVASNDELVFNRNSSLATVYCYIVILLYMFCRQQPALGRRGCQHPGRYAIEACAGRAEKAIRCRSIRRCCATAGSDVLCAKAAWDVWRWMAVAMEVPVCELGCLQRDQACWYRLRLHPPFLGSLNYVAHGNLAIFSCVVATMC